MTVAVITQTSTGTREIRQVVAPAALASVFEGTGAQFLIGHAVTALDRQLKAGCEVRKLHMPFDGIAVGGNRDSRAADLNEVYEQAIALSAALGVSTFGVSEKSDPDWHAAYHAWARQIEAEAETAGMPWKTRFNIALKTGSGSAKVVVNYLYAGYVANFAVIRPKPSYDKRSLKVKLYDLRSVRRASPIAIDRCEMLIGVPPRNMPGLTRKDQKAVAECLEWVVHEGKQEGVTVHRFADAEEVLSHLKQAA